MKEKKKGSGVCVYYCSTYYKAVREGGGGGSDPAISGVEPKKKGAVSLKP